MWPRSTATLSCKIVGTLRCFQDMPTSFPLFLLELKKMLYPIPYPLNQCCLTFLFIPKPAIKWTTLSLGRGDVKKTLTLKFLREEYQMSQPILQLSVDRNSFLLSEKKSEKKLSKEGRERTKKLNSHEIPTRREFELQSLKI